MLLWRIWFVKLQFVKKFLSFRIKIPAFKFLSFSVVPKHRAFILLLRMEKSVLSFNYGHLSHWRTWRFETSFRLKSWNISIRTRLFLAFRLFSDKWTVFMLEWKGLFINFQGYLTVWNMGLSSRYLIWKVKQVILLVVMEFLVVEFDLVKRKGRLIIVHVLLDLVPIAVAPNAKRCDQDDFIHEIPLALSGTYPERWLYDILCRVLIKVGEAGYAIVVSFSCDMGLSRQLELTTWAINS